MIENRLQGKDIGVTVSLQEKGGIYQAVLSYKDIDDKWKTKWKSTKIKVKAGNKKIAKEKAENIREQFEKEIINRLKPKRTGIEEQLDMEFIDFMNMRLEETNVKRKYEYDTYAGYKANINIRMKEYFGSSKDPSLQQNKKHTYKVSEINSDIIDKFFTYLSIDCNLKNTTIKHFRNQISVAYEILEQRNIMPKPTRGIEKLKEEVYKSETYSMQELNKLLKIFKNDVIEIPVLLAAYYGLRRSEAVGLKWSAIDFDNNYIYINHTIIEISGCGNKLIENKLIAKDRTKTLQSNRKLPLYKEIKEALLKKKERIQLNIKLFKKDYITDYIDYVCVKDDGSLIKPNHISHRFLKVIRRNGLKEIRFHDLRHTIGTELSANGVDLKAIGEFLGHGNLSTTRRYAHPDERVKQRVMEKYDDLIHGIDTNENEQKGKKIFRRRIVRKKALNVCSTSNISNLK